MREIKKLSVVDKILLGQSLIIMVVTIVFFVYSGLLGAKSAIYGGLAALVPNLYFANKIKKSTGKSAKKVVGSFYSGESGKFLMTVFMFALIFQDVKINVIAVLLTYVAALTVFWFALLIRKY